MSLGSGLRANAGADEWRSSGSTSLLPLHAGLQLPALISNPLLKREAAFQHGSRHLKGGGAGAPRGKDRQQKELSFLMHINMK